MALSSTSYSELMENGIEKRETGSLSDVLRLWESPGYEISDKSFFRLSSNQWTLLESEFALDQEIGYHEMTILEGTCSENVVKAMVGKAVAEGGNTIRAPLNTGEILATREFDPWSLPKMAIEIALNSLKCQTKNVEEILSELRQEYYKIELWAYNVTPNNEQFWSHLKDYQNYLLGLDGEKPFHCLVAFQDLISHDEARHIFQSRRSGHLALEPCWIRFDHHSTKDLPPERTSIVSDLSPRSSSDDSSIFRSSLPFDSMALQTFVESSRDISDLLEKMSCLLVVQVKYTVIARDKELKYQDSRIIGLPDEDDCEMSNPNSFLVAPPPISEELKLQLEGAVYRSRGRPSWEDEMTLEHSDKFRGKDWEFGTMHAYGVPRGYFVNSEGVKKLKLHEIRTVACFFKLVATNGSVRESIIELKFKLQKRGNDMCRTFLGPPPKEDLYKLRKAKMLRSE